MSNNSHYSISRLCLISASTLYFDITDILLTTSNLATTY